jgi:hypothetical protein
MSKSTVLYGGLALILMLVGGQVAAGAPVSGAKPLYYLTPQGLAGDEALTACAAGFHMAALWEIFDPSTNQYDTTRGRTAADAGFGPPTEIYRWIRTGFSASGRTSGQQGAGRDNCEAWTIDHQGQGTMVALSSAWGGAPTRIGPWQARTTGCAESRPVWCVEDTP